MNKIILSVFFVCNIAMHAQKVNDYPYVIVPEKYTAMKKTDQFQINSLTKFLLNKYGFEAYLETDDKPFSMTDAACEVLYADLTNDSNFIQTRLNFLLKDCNGAVIFKTTQGRSKEKEYKVAYHKALREAFEDIRDLNYEYNGTKAEHTISAREAVTENISELENNNTEVANSPFASLKVIENVKYPATMMDAKDKMKQEMSSDNNTQPLLYTSEDGFYRAVELGTSITFYEGDKVIGSSLILKDANFPIKTSEFEGNAYYKEGRLIVERDIKGVVGLVEMIFTKQE